MSIIIPEDICCVCWKNTTSLFQAKVNLRTINFVTSSSLRGSLQKLLLQEEIITYCIDCFAKCHTIDYLKHVKDGR